MAVNTLMLTVKHYAYRLLCFLARHTLVVVLILAAAIAVMAATSSVIYNFVNGQYCNVSSDLEKKICGVVASIITFAVYMSFIVTVMCVTHIVYVFRSFRQLHTYAASDADELSVL